MSAISGISSAASLYQTLSTNTDTQGIKGHHHGGGRHKDGGLSSLLDTTSTATNSASSTNGSSAISSIASSLLDAVQTVGAATTGITVNQLG